MECEAIRGRSWKPHTDLVTREALRAFAEAIAEADPVYNDTEAARREGHPDILVPPTFLFCLDFEKNRFEERLAELEIAMDSILHAGQSFEYTAPVHAGDELISTTRVVDSFKKKNETLLFVIFETRVERDARLVANLRSTLVSRIGNA
jgi:acyl dehydratase